MDLSGLSRLSRSRTTSGMVDPSGSLLGGDHVHDQSVRSFVTARSRLSGRSFLEPTDIPLHSIRGAHDPQAVSQPHHDNSIPKEGEILNYGRRPTRPPDTGPSVLALDGGGCRGYLTLLVLGRLLRLVQPDGPIYPYQYFDLICGTSTGGLIAILLGVLHLDIDTAIEHYELLAGQIFAKGFSMRRLVWKEAGYSRKPLESAIHEILNRHGGDRTLMLDPEKDKGCRCAVTTTYCDGIRRDVMLVRSYETPKSEPGEAYDHPWTIEEAILATSAAPTYFNRYAIPVGEKRAEFEDAGAHHANNPAKLAWKECQRIPDLKEWSSMFISLGTGSAPRQPASGVFGLFKTQIDTFRSLVGYATDVHKVDKQMERKAGESRAPQEMSYFRLNPPLVEKIDLGDWRKLPDMKDIADKFYDNNKDYFDTIANKLREFQKAN